MKDDLQPMKNQAPEPNSLTRRRLFKATAVAMAGTAPQITKAAPSSGGPGVLDIVIIGAGLAGLTAARDLQSAGCTSFAVLEARNRVGGRTYSHDLGGGVVSEAGGQWIGPGQTAIADLARELNVGTFATYYQGNTSFLAGNIRATQDLQGGVGSTGSIAEALSTLSRQVPCGTPWKAPDAVLLDRQSLGQWIAQQNPSSEEKFSMSLAATLTMGAVPGQISLLHYLSVLNSANSSYHNLESIKDGAQETRFVGGSQVLSLKMAHALGDKLRLSCPVHRISGWDRDVVELHTDKGTLRARQAIVALNPALCHQIAFDPPLPAGRAQLQQRWPAHAPMRKTVHVYPRPFWRDAGLNGQIMPLEGPLLWSYDNSPPDGSVGVLSAFVKPGALPSESKIAERTLSAIYARALGEKALHPIQFHDHDWGKADPWSLTCIHPLPPGFWTKWGQHLHPAVGRLLWSGTETADIWAGSMDGAVRAGHRAALQALGSLGK